MNTKNLLAIRAKSAVAVWGLVAMVGVMLPSCRKEPASDPEPNPYEGTIDPIKVFTFDRNVYHDNNFAPRDSVMKYANDPRIEKIIYFLDSTNGGNDCRGSDDYVLHKTRCTLEERINYAPDKSIGAGTFVPRPGAMRQDDSIWLVDHGWKIKPSRYYYQKNRCR